MKIFVTGATGYIGAAVTEKLRAVGHRVAGLARSLAAVHKLVQLGAEAVRGDLRDGDILAQAAASADAVIHLAMEPSREAPQLDAGVVDAVLGALRGSGKAFLYTSGIWVMGDTGGNVVDETTPVNPTPLVAWRPSQEDRVRQGDGLRGIVIRPAMVYGRGGGIVGGFAASAREKGVVQVVGTGENRWPFVHVDRLADLYVLALHAPGSLYFASWGPSIPVREVAAAAAHGARLETIPLETARQSMGPLADALTLDQLVSAEKAVRELGWKPQAPSVLEEQ
jgi:nucleoside-diphosphate-sugar epimerase